MQEAWTNLGLAGATLFILFFIVKYFVAALTEKDRYNSELAGKLVEITRSNTQSNLELSKAIEVNTQVTKSSADDLSRLMLEVIKGNGGKLKK